MKKHKLFDSLRNISIEALPEEIVRQKLLQRMIGPLNFPKNLIAVEKEIDLIRGAHTKTDRRADIICFTPKKDALIPLILIECKAVEFSENTLEQVLGYNEVVGAKFVGIANFENTHIYWQERSGLKSVDFLPTYQELVRAAYA